MKNKFFYKSLSYALCGFKDAVKSERNLKFHIVIGNLICFFAFHFGISKVEWAILFLAISSVITAELLNSAVERAVDTATREIKPEAKHAKDFAASATLVTAVFGVAVGIMLFADWVKIVDTLIIIFTNPISIAALMVLLIIDIRILLIKHSEDI